MVRSRSTENPKFSQPKSSSNRPSRFVIKIMLEVKGPNQGGPLEKKGLLTGLLRSIRYHLIFRLTGSPRTVWPVQLTLTADESESILGWT